MVDEEFLLLLMLLVWWFELTCPHSAKLVIGVVVVEVVVLLGLDRLVLRCRQTLGREDEHWKEWKQIMKHEKKRNQGDWLESRDNSEWKLRDHRHLLTLSQQR